MQRAIELNPNDAMVRIIYSGLLISVDRPEEAMAEVERARELDPLDHFGQFYVGWILLGMRRYDDAITQLRKSLELEPNFFVAHINLRIAFRGKQMYEEALAAAKKFFVVLGDSEGVEALERGYAEAGYLGAMSLAARSKLSYVPAMYDARFYALAGEKDRALECLGKAYEEREPTMAYLRADANWDDLHDDPRFQDLLRRMNFPE